MSSNYRTGSVATLSPQPSNVGRTTAHYLFAISTLSEESAGRVTTGQLRRYLDVSPASVTEMVAKLDERRLVDHEKYQGVRLTDQGEALAARVAWRLCIVTGFFDSALDTTLEERTAFEIGFTLPEEGVHRLRERIEAPCLDVCPESGHHDTSCLI